MGIVMTEEFRAAEKAAGAKLLALSNWGRWGEDDQRGALNFVSLESIKRGTRAIKKGKTYRLSQDITGGGMGGYHSASQKNLSPILMGRPASLHFMAVDGGDWAAGAGSGQRRHTAEDTVIITPHCGATHVDSLAHTWTDRKMYNGVSENVVRSYGSLRNGIENLVGIVTRGILLDMAGFRGVEIMDADDYVTEDDVVRCCAAEGVTIESGDAVVVHTGWPKVFAEDAERYSGLQPGVGSSAAYYLARKEICVLGADNTAVQPFNGYNPVTTTVLDDPRGDLGQGLHEAYLRNLGIYLLEIMDLSLLAADRVYQFLFCMAPLMIRGGTGSPVNPLAVA